MSVIVDTCVWSAALRRDAPGRGPEIAGLSSLIQDGRVQMLGLIRQELLSGVKSEKLFNSLCAHLEAFPDLVLETGDHVMAAQFYNLCRAKGVQGSNTDFLICAAAVRRHMTIYTTDNDFLLFAKFLPISLH